RRSSNRFTVSSVPLWPAEVTFYVLARPLIANGSTSFRRLGGSENGRSLPTAVQCVRRCRDRDAGDHRKGASGRNLYPDRFWLPVRRNCARGVGVLLRPSGEQHCRSRSLRFVEAERWTQLRRTTGTCQRRGASTTIAATAARTPGVRFSGSECPG